MANTTSNPVAQYWDACLFIAHLQDKEDEKEMVDTISTLFRDAEAGKIQIVTSPLVMAEVRPYADRYESDRFDYIEDLFRTNRPFIRSVATTGAIGRYARQIATQHPTLRVMDALHIASALFAKSDVMFTLDGVRDPQGRRRTHDLTSFSGKIGNPPLDITAPRAYDGELLEWGKSQP